MTSYTGRHAELYDIFYSDKPYQQEANFIHKQLKTHSESPVHRIMEFACGTGTHAMLLEKYGYEIEAMDSSPDMLAIARSKASVNNSKVKFCDGDMRNLDSDGIKYDAVLCLFDSIGYVRDNDSIMKVLHGVREILSPGGLFIFEFWHAPAMLLNYEPVRVKEFFRDDRRVVRISRTTLDYRCQLAEVNYTIYEFDEASGYYRFEERQVNRFFQTQEMMLFLNQAGFIPLKWMAGYSDSEDIDENTWHVVAIAKRYLENP